MTVMDTRPDLVPGVYEVALETLPDIPGEGPVAGTYEEFRMRDVDHPHIPHGAFAVAVDSAGGRVVGYASLQLQSAGRKVA